MILFLKGDGIDDGFYSVLKISQLQHVEKNAEENAEKFNKIPAFIKRFLIKHSFAMAELIQSEKDGCIYVHQKVASLNIVPMK
jgi:hypothetical protein